MIPVDDLLLRQSIRTTYLPAHQPHDVRDIPTRLRLTSGQGGSRQPGSRNSNLIYCRRYWVKLVSVRWHQSSPNNVPVIAVRISKHFPTRLFVHAKPRNPLQYSCRSNFKSAKRDTRSFHVGWVICVTRYFIVHDLRNLGKPCGAVRQQCTTYTAGFMQKMAGQ